MSDLDARVAALMDLIMEYADLRFDGDIDHYMPKKKEIEQTIRAELQKPAQEEITDEQWLDIAEAHANLDWDSRKPDGFLNAVISVGKAAIRASKGEKT